MTEKSQQSKDREKDVALSHTEEQDVRDNQSLNSVSLYAIVHREGLEELQRPVMSLWWSGVAAGIGISLSILAEGILHYLFEDSQYQFVIENLGYTVGFVLETFRKQFVKIFKNCSFQQFCMKLRYTVNRVTSND